MAYMLPVYDWYNIANNTILFKSFISRNLLWDLQKQKARKIREMKNTNLYSNQLGGD